MKPASEQSSALAKNTGNYSGRAAFGKRSDRSVSKTRRLSAALILYICIVLWVVLLSREPSETTVIKLHSETILYFLGYYPDWQSDVTALHPEAMIHGDILNVILFIPFGLLTEAILLDKQKKTSLLWCTASGFAFSFLIEVIQLLTRRGWFDADDLLMNMLGAAAGAVLYLLIDRVFHNMCTRPKR